MQDTGPQPAELLSTAVVATPIAALSGKPPPTCVTTLTPNEVTSQVVVHRAVLGTRTPNIA